VEEASFTVPALTTVGPAPRLIAERIFVLIDGGDFPAAQHHSLDYVVIARDST
jgi:hypothetical protein